MSDDLISRHAAIDAIEQHKTAVLGEREWEEDIDIVYGYAVAHRQLADIIKRLPSARPDGWLEQNKDKILQAGMEGREIDFHIGGRLRKELTRSARLWRYLRTFSKEVTV